MLEQQEAMAFADQLSAAARDVFIEKGYDVEFSLAIDIGGAVVFSMDPKGAVLTQEIVDGILQEAASRIGCKS
jgi:hypothetical protein